MEIKRPEEDIIREINEIAKPFAIVGTILIILCLIDELYKVLIQI